MNVLVVHRDLPFHGGVSRVFRTLAEERNARAVTLHVATFAPPDPTVRWHLEEHDVRVHVLSDGYLAAVLRLRRLLHLHDVDVVMATSLKAYISAKLAAVGRASSVAFAIHSVPLVIQGRVRRRVFRALAREDPLIFASQAIADAHAWPGHRGMERVILNGVRPPRDADGTSPCPREQAEVFGVPAEAITLGYIAEFVDWKDHETLLRAFELVCARGADAHLFLIGTGARLDHVRRRALRSREAHRVHFLGAREDARRLLGMLDIYVHPANGEGFGLAVVEAMLAERAIAAANAGAIPELLTHGRTGLLVPAAAPDALAETLEQLMRDPQLRRALGRRARAEAEVRFTPAACAGAHERAWAEFASA